MTSIHMGSRRCSKEQCIDLTRHIAMRCALQKLALLIRVWKKTVLALAQETGLKNILCGGLVILWLGGCQSHATSPETRAALNNLSVTPTTNRTVRSNKTSTSVERKSEPRAITPLSIRQAIDQMVPHSYFVDIDDEINLNATVHINPAQNWLEALGQGVSEADIELITNLNKKSLFLRLKKITLAEVIDRLLPEDFTVFTDADVNLQTLIYFDTRDDWVQAFHRGTRGAGIDFSVNFTSKVISLSAVSTAPERAGDSAATVTIR